jgi:hypothetical protein
LLTLDLILKEIALQIITHQKSILKLNLKEMLIIIVKPDLVIILSLILLKIKSKPIILILLEAILNMFKILPLPMKYLIFFKMNK